MALFTDSKFIVIVLVECFSSIVIFVSIFYSMLTYFTIAIFFYNMVIVEVHIRI